LNKSVIVSEIDQHYVN